MPNHTAPEGRANVLKGMSFRKQTKAANVPITLQDFTRAMEERDEKREDATVKAIEKLTTAIINMNEVKTTKMDKIVLQKSAEIEKEKEDVIEDWNEAMNQLDKEEELKQQEREQAKRTIANLQNQLMDQDDPNETTDKDDDVNEEDDNTEKKTKKINPKKIEDNLMRKLEYRIKNLERQMTNQIIKNRECMDKLIETKENCEKKHTKTKVTNFWKTQQTNEQDKGYKTPENKETERNDEEDDDFQIVKNKKKKNYIPVTGISPGEGTRDNTDKEPEISWAKTTYRTIAQKKQKVDIPQETVEMYPEIDNEDSINYLDKVNKEGKKMLAEITEEANTKIGFSPITRTMLKEELNLIRNKGIIDTNKEYNKAMIMATKNALTRFMKVHLKLDEQTRNSIRIKEIYPSQSETSNTIYIKCQSSDDIAKITAAAINLPKTNYDEDPPSLVQYVPKTIF